MTGSRLRGSVALPIVTTILAILLARNATAQISSPSPVDKATGVALTAGLSWRADPKATRYDVYLGTTSQPPVVSRNQGGTSYQPTAMLQPSTTYYWRVDSKGAKGYSTAGVVWSFTTTAPPPPAPSLPTGASPQAGATGVAVASTLSWSSSTNASSYDVAFGTATPPPTVSTGQTTTTYTPPASLSYSQTYYWSVTAKGAGGATAGPTWSFTTTPPPPSTARDRLRLLTWNVQSGRDANGALAVNAQADMMADSGADVIALQEVTITPDSGDLTILYKSRLESLTGVPWYQLWAPEPRASSYAPEGNLILSRIPVIASSTTQFDGAPSDPSTLDAKQSAAAATVVVNNVSLTVLATRMPTDAALRQSQGATFSSWASSFQAPRVVGGDLEVQPGDAVYSSLASSFTDTWPVLAGANEYGFTVDAREGLPAPARLDYWLQEAADTHARVSEVWVVKTTRSDHHAVVVDVDVR